MTALTITLDRTGLSLAPLVLSGVSDANDLGISRYQPPSLQARITYAPDSAGVVGSEAIASSWQQAILGFDFVTDRATSESDVAASYAEVVAAIGQHSFTVTTQVSGAPAEVWRADRGSIALSASGGRSFVDLSNPGAVEFAVSIPVYPIAS